MPMRIRVLSESGSDKVGVQDRRRDSQTARAEASSAVCDSVSASFLWCPEDVGTRAVGERKKSSDQNSV